MQENLRKATTYLVDNIIPALLNDLNEREYVLPLNQVLHLVYFVFSKYHIRLKPHILLWFIIGSRT